MNNSVGYASIEEVTKTDWNGDNDMNEKDKE